ncbi:hypothetical protein ACIBL8_43100 [Streptomyces sp. NPDC050523]|uniref:hypothetical protein n=1 Tax=Streptomyces sp. NPDC050523 TaxID=3365622 RepID=UPI0037971D68
MMARVSSAGHNGSHTIGACPRSRRVTLLKADAGTASVHGAEDLVDGRELAGETDGLPHVRRLRGDVERLAAAALVRVPVQARDLLGGGPDGMLSVPPCPSRVLMATCAASMPGGQEVGWLMGVRD